MADGEHPANPNGALMREWEFWKSTPDFPRLKRWLETIRLEPTEAGTLIVHPHTDGQMWGCFMAGFLAAREQAAGIADQEAQSVDEGEIYIANLIAKRIRAMNDPDDPAHGDDSPPEESGS